MFRAFKIVTKEDNPGSFNVFIAESAGNAKTQVIAAMQNAGYNNATYSWITSCHRAPEYDYLADKGPGCVAWKIIDWYNGNEEWQIDK